MTAIAVDVVKLVVEKRITPLPAVVVTGTIINGVDDVTEPEPNVWVPV